MYVSNDVMWTLIAAALIFLMQAGFAMCETGFSRAKNAGNILMKNVLDMCIGSLVFWFVGFGIMFGSQNPVFGRIDFFTLGNYDFGGLPKYCYLAFEMMFCATAATIVSGSMAERTNFKAYCIYSAVISLIVYPVSGHWIWGGGWLQGMGFHDIAGSTTVHLVGGTAACIGAILLGPRIGKYTKEGRARAIMGHNIPLVALGAFLLWFGWYGFNGGSTVAMSTDGNILTASKVFVNTTLSAAASVTAVMLLTWRMYKKPDVSLCMNGIITGLVAITAGCDVMAPIGAAVTGMIAGIIMVLSVELFDKILKIDDPVGAISVHGVSGIVGTLLVGIFDTKRGLLFGGGVQQLCVQFIGVISVVCWVAVTMYIGFKCIDNGVGLRVSEEEELEGLDMAEHGLTSAYAGFNITDALSGFMDINENTDLGEDFYDKASKKQIDMAVPVIGDVPKTNTEGKRITPYTESGMCKITILCRQNKFEALKKALNELGVTGMTATQVLGCGIQRGVGKTYRGVEIDATLLPKVQVDVIICSIPVYKVVEAAKKALYTGHIGDGKIFVYEVKHVVKIRTGEEDKMALQDVE